MFQDWYSSFISRGHVISVLTSLSFTSQVLDIKLQHWREIKHSHTCVSFITTSLGAIFQSVVIYGKINFSTRSDRHFVFYYHQTKLEDKTNRILRTLNLNGLSIHEKKNGQKKSVSHHTTTWSYDRNH